MTLRRCKYRRS